MNQNIIALVDCNSFYCSCERVFKPSLNKKPVIVLSNNDGCVVSRTDEAKALKIPMGIPYFQIKELCKKNDVHVFSSNYALYGDMSRRVMRTLAKFTPEMEIYSIDEAFLNLTGFEIKNLSLYAQEIKNTVFQNTGIPVSVGIGPTKVLSKIANHLAKKDKIKTNCIYNLLEFKDIDAVLKTVPVGEIWGIGRKSTLKLENIKIKTAFDFKYANERVIEKILTITGRRILEELRGEQKISLDLMHSDKKQIISSRSFGKPVYTLEDLKESVANHITTAAEKLRSQKCITNTIVVFIQTNPYKNIPQYYNSATIKLLSGSSSTNKLIHQAFIGLEKIYQKGFEYKKVGVIFVDIQKKSQTQLDFFNAHDSVKDDLLMETLDKVNQKEGRGALKFAACGIDQFWKMLSEMKSPNYSTRWSDILRVK